MIKREETGLSEADYTTLLANDGLFAQRVTLRRRNLAFGPSVASLYTPGPYQFDADVFEDALMMLALSGGTLYATRLASQALDTHAWEALASVDSNVASVRPSWGRGEGLHAFYVKGNTVWHASSADSGASWVREAIFTPSTDAFGGTLSHIAAESDTRVFVALYRSDFNTHLVTLLKGESWTATASNVYLPHKLTGLDAEAASDPSDPAHRAVVVMSCDLPSQVGQEVVGSTTRSVTYQRNGILAFFVRGTRFSDHIEVERFDDASAYQQRQSVFLTRLPNGRLVLTARGMDGNARYCHEALHYYFSADGRYWEQDDLVQLEGVPYGGPIVTVGDYTFLCLGWLMYASYTTELAGVPAQEITEDLTDYIVRWRSEQAGARIGAFQIKDEAGWSVNSLLFTPGTHSILTEVGVWSGGEKKLTQHSHDLVDAVSLSRDFPGTWDIKTRDLSALLNSVRHCPHAIDRETQLVGADTFVNTLGTPYGGLSHVQGALGSWSAATDNTLVLRSDNKRGVGLSTFKTDIWNGLIQARFAVTEAGPDQFAGLVFRAVDYDNLYSVDYTHDEDTLTLYELRGGTRATLASVPSLGWSDAGYHYLRVYFRYGLCRISTSSDGKTWTIRLTTVLPGKAIAGGVYSLYLPVQYEEGAVGFTGQGYSEEDEWSYTPWEGYSEPVTSGQASPATLLKGTGTIALFSTTGKLHRTRNFNVLGTLPSYEHIDLGVSVIQNFVVDAQSYGTGRIDGWIKTANSICRVRDIFGTPQVLTDKTFSAAASWHVMDMSWTLPGWGININVYPAGLYASFTMDGANWSDEVLIGTKPDLGVLGDGYKDWPYWSISGPGLYMSPVTPGLAYTSAFIGHARHTFRSTDWGATWTTTTDRVLQIGSGAAPFHVPYNNGSPDSDDFAYVASVGRGDGGFSMYRRAGGQTTQIDSHAPRHGRWGISTYVRDRMRVAWCGGREESGNGADNNVRLSVDGGATYTEGPLAWQLAISGDDPDTVYAWGFGGAVCYTEDWGETWLDRSVGAGDVLIGICGG